MGADPDSALLLPRMISLADHRAIMMTETWSRIYSVDVSSSSGPAEKSRRRLRGPAPGTLYESGRSCPVSLLSSTASAPAVVAASSVRVASEVLSFPAANASLQAAEASL